jgi:hypothetical protein
MKELSEKAIRAIEIAAGIILGVGTWVLLWLSGETKDGLLQYAWVALFAIIMFGGKAIEKKLDRNLKTYRLVLLITLGVGLVVFAILAFTHTKL